MSGVKNLKMPGAWMVWALTGATFALYLALSLARWHRWDNPSWDLAIFEQAVKGYANLGWAIVDIKGPGFNQLGDHFSPLLVLLAPFYRLFPSPVTLLVAQCVLVAISVIPLTFVARRILGHWSGIAIGTGYALSWGIQSAVDVQFHEYALAAPILAFGLAAALDKRWRAACVWIVVLMGVKEDLGLTVAGFGVVLWLWGQRRRALWMGGIGIGGMALVLLVIIPLFNPNRQYDYWGKLADDDGASAGLLASLTNTALGTFTPGIKYQTLLLLLVITAFVAVRSPLLLMIVPTMLWRFAGSTEFYWGTTWHYSIILMPILFAAAIDGLRLARLSRHKFVRSYARVVPASIVVVALVLLPRYPLWDLTKPESYEQPERVEAAKRAIANMPPGSTVASDVSLIVQLASDHTVFWLGPIEGVQPDFVVLDRMAAWIRDYDLDAAQHAENTFPGTAYRLIFGEGGYQVAERISAPF